MGKFKIIPIFVPHKGCPHQCSFCNQKHITGQIEDMTPKKAEEIINQYLTTINSEKNYVEIAFYGGSFTAIDINLQNSLLAVAKKYKDSGRVHGIRLSTRPDYIDNKILDNLLSYGVTDIELGVQSMKDEVLLANERGHSSQDVLKAVSLIRNYSFKLGLQQMIGLIGDTADADIYTAEKIAELSPDFVRIYPTLVFKNTKMADLYYKGDFKPLTVNEAVEICRSLVKIYDKFNIKIIRLGLLMSATEARDNFVDGPYYPNFRELI